MSAQADTCVGAELDQVLAADRAWNGVAWQRPAKGQGEEEQISGWRAAPRCVCVGVGGNCVPEGRLQGWLPITTRT